MSDDDIYLSVGSQCFNAERIWLEYILLFGQFTHKSKNIGSVPLAPDRSFATSDSYVSELWALTSLFSPLRRAKHGSRYGLCATFHGIAPHQLVALLAILLCGARTFLCFDLSKQRHLNYLKRLYYIKINIIVNTLTSNCSLVLSSRPK